MPILDTTTYHAHSFSRRSGHLQSILPTLFRKVQGLAYIRARIATPDDDFLDVDWSMSKSKHVKGCAILSHGLEGNTNRFYIRGMAKSFNLNQWDVLAWNYRGCSGTINKTLRAYHSGATEDLQTVIEYVRAENKYEKIVLVGFSLGGNLTLKYLGEAPEYPRELYKAVTFSVPCDLAASSNYLARFGGRLYTNRFLKSLRKKIEQKMNAFPGRISDTAFKRIKTLKDFDDYYTAPLHGFQNAADYYAKCSAKPFLPQVEIPTLIVSAKNDPFLPKECYPIEEAKSNPNLFLEIPEHGGHIGFMTDHPSGLYWSEMRALGFIESQ
jgi:uncharacterized protein